MSLITVKTSVLAQKPTSSQATVIVEVLENLSNVTQTKKIILPDNKSDLLRLTDELWRQNNKPSLYPADSEQAYPTNESKKMFQENVVNYILKSYSNTDAATLNSNLQNALYIPESVKSKYVEIQNANNSAVMASVVAEQEKLKQDYEQSRTTLEEAIVSHDSAPDIDYDPAAGDLERDAHGTENPPNADELMVEVRSGLKSASRSQRPVREVAARTALDKRRMENPMQHLGRIGLMGDELIEPVPAIMSYPGDWHRESKNNSGIIAGSDEHYRIRAHTKSGAVYVYAGRSPHGVQTELQDGLTPQDNSLLLKKNNLIKDAAYLYLSQKSDPSPLLQVAEGTYGKAKKTKYPRLGLSLAAIKADDVVIMARESGIRLITGTDRLNSKGGEVVGKFGIDLIAGNDDSDLQPLVKGDNLVRYLTGLSKALDELHAIVYSFLKSQIEFNTSVSNHRHFDPFCIMLGSTAIGNPTAFLEGKNLQSTECLRAGTKSMLEGVQQQFNAAKQALNRVNNDFNALNDVGSYKIVSERNRTN